MRELCSSVLLQFLLDYPVGQRRLQQHLHFLLANLGFEHASGRQAAASTLRALCFKLPGPLLDTWAPVFFLPLVAQQVNEDDATCRRELSAAVLALFQVRVEGLRFGIGMPQNSHGCFAMCSMALWMCIM